MARRDELSRHSKVESGSIDVMDDPLVSQFAKHALEQLGKNVDLKVLVERLSTKYNVSKETVRKSVLLVIKSLLP